ncbi:MAG TPA: hypothetical protein VHY22_13505 [Chthoniobacteraceae bacterium]|jgi:hypothetical protein|nr:hypothetical protein [Chthoniobacteraceae bacterium]
MSASFDLQSGIAKLLTPEALPAPNIPVLMRRPKELQSDIEEAILKQTLGIYINPPLPTRALDSGGPVLFFSDYEVRVRVVEQPKLNDKGADAYEVAEAIAEALHWSNPEAPDGTPMLAIPMKINPGRPLELIEDPTYRVIDVVFIAALQINKQG